MHKFMSIKKFNNKKFYIYTPIFLLILLFVSSGCRSTSLSDEKTTKTTKSAVSEVDLSKSDSTSPVKPQKIKEVDKQVPEFEDKLALATHLQKIGAKFYGAFWCPYCKRQKKIFGDEAIKKINYIECDPGGENPQPQLCKAAKISAFPTWEIKGKLYPGYLTLEQLADKSEYTENDSSSSKVN